MRVSGEGNTRVCLPVCLYLRACLSVCMYVGLRVHACECVRTWRGVCACWAVVTSTGGRWSRRSAWGCRQPSDVHLAGGDVMLPAASSAYLRGVGRCAGIQPPSCACAATIHPTPPPRPRTMLRPRCTCSTCARRRHTLPRPVAAVVVVAARHGASHLCPATRHTGYSPSPCVRRCGRSSPSAPPRAPRRLDTARLAAATTALTTKTTVCKAHGDSPTTHAAGPRFPHTVLSSLIGSGWLPTWSESWDANVLAGHAAASMSERHVGSLGKGLRPSFEPAVSKRTHKRIIASTMAVPGC